MNPIPGQLIDFFVHEGYPGEEIFNLFIEKMVVRRSSCKASDHLPNCELILINTPGRDLELDLSQAMIEYVLNIGLSTEKIQEDKKSSNDINKCATTVITNPDGSKQCQAPAPKYRFCYAPRWAALQELVPPKARCGYFTDNKNAGAAAQSEVIGDKGKKTTTASIRIPDGVINGLIGIAQRDVDNGEVDTYGYAERLELLRGNEITIDYYTRSTEGIIYYLGEVVRRQVSPDSFSVTGNRIVQIKLADFNATIPLVPVVPCPIPGSDGSHAFVCSNLFVVDNDPTLAGTALSVNYNGLQYSVPNDVHRAGRSMHVLSLVKQLLAVNTSAKSLPQTNVISTITQ
jgi:hypothetical protein